MKASNYSLLRYEADEGKVFDWKEPRYIEEIDIDGNPVIRQEHLMARVLFIGENDTIRNYVEVDSNGFVTELAEYDYATYVDYEEALADLGVVE